MYTQQDYDNAKRSRQRMLTINCLLLAATVAVLVLALVFRWKIAGIAGVVAGWWLTYFFYCMKTQPWIKYCKFLRDMREGLSRETDAQFVSVTPEPRLSDGVSVHDFVVRVGEAEEDQRLFLWDDDKPLPTLREGQPLHIVSFGNYIKALS